MYHVVEFDQSNGGGVGIVRDIWLTPKKTECFWPPEKHSGIFNKRLTEGTEPQEDWQLCQIKRIFCSTGDLSKARVKETRALEESDLQSLDEGECVTKKRSRKPNKALLFSSDEDGDEDEEDNVKHKQMLRELPKTPSSVAKKTYANRQSGLFSPNLPDNQGPAIQSLSPSTSSSNGSGNGSHGSPAIVNSGSQVATPSHSRLQSEHQTFSGYEVIAKHLSKIYSSLQKLEESNTLILEHLMPNVDDGQANNEFTVPNVNLPCASVDDLRTLENYLQASAENEQLLEL